MLLNILNHENIIKVIDFFNSKGAFISIMEYEDSYDLEKIVNDPETVMDEN